VKGSDHLAPFLFAVISLGSGAAVYAQEYPSKPVRLVVPFAPGGGTDVIARIIAPRLSEALGQQVVVDNRAGAGGIVGADIVAKAPPDGYTLVLGTPGPLTINPSLVPRMPYALKDFAPVTFATVSPFILVVNPALRAASVKELIALAKEKPNMLNYGSSGNGTVSHLVGEQFKALAGINIVHIAYKGSSQSLTDLMGGQIQFIFDNLLTSLPHIKSGKLRALAVGTRKRSALVPEIPTMVEAGVPGFEASTSSGVLAPAATPRERVARLNRDLVKSLRAADIKERFAALGMESVGSTPEEYAEHLKAELATNARIIKSAGIKTD